MRAELFLALAAVSCKAVSAIDVTPPEDVTFAAVVTVDGAGTILESSKLTRWNPRDPLPVFVGEDDRALVLGYTDAQLAPLGVIAAIDEKAIHLRSVTGCAQSLPPPRWALDSSFRELPPEEAPRVAPSEVELACPEIATSSIALETTCPFIRCPLTLTERTRCTFDFTTDCPIGRVHAVIHPDGSACFDLPGSEWTCEPLDGPAAPDVKANATCTQPGATCEVALHVADTPAPPPFDLQRITIYDARPHYGQHFGTLPLINVGELHSGYLHDFAFVGNYVVVLGFIDKMPRISCPQENAGGMFVYELETGAFVRQVAIPKCVERLLPHEDGETFYGFYRESVFGEHQLARIDLEGHILESAPSRIDRRYVIKDIGRAQDGRIVVLGSGAMDGDLALYDPLTLARTGTVSSDDPLDMHAMMQIDDGDFMIVSDSLRIVERADVNQTRIVDRLELPRDGQRHSAAFDVVYHPETQRVIVGSNGYWEMFAGPVAGPMTGMTSWERDLAVLTATPWPLDPTLALAGAVTMEGTRASLVMVDPTTARFQRGIWEVGHGLVGRMRVDRRGRIWAMLPWIAQLVVLTPK